MGCDAVHVLWLVAVFAASTCSIEWMQLAVPVYAVCTGYSSHLRWCGRDYWTYWSQHSQGKYVPLGNSLRKCNLMCFIVLLFTTSDFIVV